MTEQCTDTKTRKASYKFDIVFILVFLAILITGTFYVRHFEYEGGLVNKMGLSILPWLYFTAIELLMLLFFSIRFLIRVCRPSHGIKHILIIIACVVMPYAIFFGSSMITTPLAAAFINGFEKWVLKEVDIKAIQQWLATEGQKYKGQLYGYGEFPNDFPACLTESKPNYIYFGISELDGTLYIEFNWGGGMSSWGVRVGSPSMKMPEEGEVKIRESYYEDRRPIAPGVYIFDGG